MYVFFTFFHIFGDSGGNKKCLWKKRFVWVIVLCFCCTILQAVIQLLYILEIHSKFHKKLVPPVFKTKSQRISLPPWFAVFIGKKIEKNITTKCKLEFGMYPQSMPTEWTHARTLRPWQSVRLDL